MEIRTRVKPIRVTLQCEECEKGELVVSNAPIRASIPPQIQHVCNECGAVKWIRGKSYPRIEYEED